MQANRIEDMDFKELRKEVQRLSDDLARTKRSYEDLLYNLDEDNFSGIYRKKTKSMESSIEQTADRIKMTVTKTLNFGDAEMSPVHPDANPEANKDNLYYYTGTVGEGKGYYYYNDIDGMWSKTSEYSIYSAFIQTAGGFEFDSSVVKISGDLIVGGEISGDLIRGGTIEGVNIRRTGSSGGESSIELDENGFSFRDVEGNLRALFNEANLVFIDDDGKKQGWGIKPGEKYGGVLEFCVHNTPQCYFGEQEYSVADERGYKSSDIALWGVGGGTAAGSITGFTVDLTDSDDGEVQFVGLSRISLDDNQPDIRANSKLLATQDWVYAQLAQVTTLG